MHIVPALSIPRKETLQHQAETEVLSENTSETNSFFTLLEMNQQTGEKANLPAEENVDEDLLAQLPFEVIYPSLDKESSDMETDAKSEAYFPVPLPNFHEVVIEETKAEVAAPEGVQTSDKNKTEAEKNIMIEQTIIPFLETMKTLLPSGHPVENIKEIASKLLPILEKWTAVKQHFNQEELEPILEKQLSKEQLKTFEFLENNVEKRNHFSNQYQQNATITRTDLTNWLQVALDRYSEHDQGRVVAPTVTPYQAMPMSEIQQHTVHLKSLERVDRIGEELTQKLVTIIKESRFLTKPNHLQPMNQLQIVLKPEHLGHITVRFQQVEGNMTVNMIVTSQAAKEMLEANIHQLKHMFSPHQVSIERDVTISDKEFYKEKQEETQDEQENLNQSEESHSNETEEDTEFDFEDFIEEFTKGGLSSSE